MYTLGMPTLLSRVLGTLEREHEAELRTAGDSHDAATINTEYRMRISRAISGDAEHLEREAAELGVSQDETVAVAAAPVQFDPFTAARPRQTGPASLVELQVIVRECARYLERCGMDEAANQLECRVFGDPADAECDAFGRAFEVRS